MKGVAQSPDAERLDVVDALRGFALLGLFLVHMVEAYELYWAAPKPDAVSDTVFLLFMGKSFSLLALCFGFSFFVMMDRAERRGTDFSARFAWRLLVLAAIGWLHALVYRGDIIQLLAAMGFLLIPANRVRSNRALLLTASLCFLGVQLIAQIVAAANGADWANANPRHWTDPAMQTYLKGNFAQTLAANLGPGQVPKWWFYLETGRVMQILGLFLIGLVLGRVGFFARPADFARQRRFALAIAIIVAMALHLVAEPLGIAFDGLGYGQGARRACDTLLAGYQNLAGTAIWALLIVALWQAGGRRLLSPLAAMGRLTLTLYVGQSVLFVPFFYGFGLGLHDDLGSAERLAFGIVAAALMMIGARLWLARFHYGPLEWLWRAATYLSADVPFRRRPLPVSA